MVGFRCCREVSGRRVLGMAAVGRVGLRRFVGCVEEDEKVVLVKVDLYVVVRKD